MSVGVEVHRRVSLLEIGPPVSEIQQRCLFLFSNFKSANADNVKYVPTMSSIQP